MGKNYRKTQCIRPKGLKKTWGDLQKQIFPLRTIPSNVLSASFIFCISSELCFKTEILPWAYISSEIIGN